MKRKLIWIIAIVLSIVVLTAGAALFARHYLFKRASEKLAELGSVLGGELVATPDNVLSDPFCFASIQFTDSKNAKISIEKLCVHEGLLSLMDDAPALDTSITRISGHIGKDSIEEIWTRLKARKASQNETAPSAKTSRTSEFVSRLRDGKLDLTIGEMDVIVGNAGRQITLRSPHTSVQLHESALVADVVFSLGVDISDVPFTVRSMPTFALHVTVLPDVFTSPTPASATETFAQLSLDATPTLDIGFAIKDEFVEAKFSKLDLEYSKRTLQASVSDLSLVLPKDASSGNAHFENIRATFDGAPSPSSLKQITLNTPVITLRIDELLNSERVTNNALLGSLLHFWQQDAGAILGTAPKLSVRREDVKKPAPKFRSNPLSKEFLLKLKTSFEQFQQSIMSLPAIDIQNGRFNIMYEDKHASFEAISFNTAELFKDAQKFKLEFNIHEATASFEISYDDDSPFPHLSLNLNELDARDFMALINMPVPEKSDGHVSASLDIGIDEESFDMKGSLNFQKFAFFHEKISPNVIHDMNASADINVKYTFKDDKLAIDPLRLTSGPITATGFVNITNVRSNPVIQFEIGAKDIKCADIPAAIPPGLLPTITELQIAGSTFSPKLYGKVPWKNPLISSLKESGFEGKCFPVVVSPHMPSVLNDPNYTFTTDYTYFTDAITIGPGTKEYTPTDKIPPFVRAAMFLTEDKRFFDHGPLRISFIERALRLNLNLRKYVYGGSTISQQLTKNLFLDRRKNLARKLEEAFIAWRMENVVSKTRIFELYINMIEFGPDIYGVTNAAKFYFNKTPSELTPLEGAYLASLKVSPSKGGRFYKSGFPTTGWWPKRMKYILKTLAENGYISPAEVIAAYPWIPQFYYPEPNSADYRNTWLKNYNNYLLEQEKKKREKKKKAENLADDKSRL